MAELHPIPQEFFSAFLAVASDEAVSIIEHWNSLRAYTDHMRRTIFPAVARRLGLECYSGDYYTLDSIFFRERDLKYLSAGVYAKSISVALEHENKPGTTAAEMNKLQIVNAPLKVLITYPTSADQAKQLLHMYVDIIHGGDQFGDNSTTRRQLVIFGSLEENKPQWRAYVYAEQKFEPLEAIDPA